MISRPSSLQYRVPEGFSGLVLQHEDLRRHTSLRVGGPADCLFIPHTLEDIQLLLRQAQLDNIPVHLLGGGTNLLVSDTGVRGWVIKISRFFNNFRRVGNHVTAGAGIILSGLIRKTVADGLSGLETLYGIPGTVGGGVTQNAGAFEAAISDRLLSLTVVNQTGALQQYSRDDLLFSYRKGPFQDERQVIIEAAFQLDPDDPEDLERNIKEIVRMRKKKFPSSKPTAGCMFENPPLNFAGKLIDQAGLKGFRLGGAMVSPVHANFIVNEGSARAADVYNLMKLVRERVRDRFGVFLKTEVKMWGFDIEKSQIHQA